MPKNGVRSSAWVVIYCTRTRRFLLGKRSSKVNNPKFWNFFGGNIDATEYPVDAAARETSEEVGVRVNRNDLIHLDTIIRSDRFMYFFLYTVEEEFRPRLNEEHSQFKWVSEKEIGSLYLHGPTKISVRRDILDRAKDKAWYENNSSKSPHFKMEQEPELVDTGPADEYKRETNRRKRKLDLKKLREYFGDQDSATSLNKRKNNKKGGGRENVVYNKRIIRNGTVNMYYMRNGGDLVGNAGIGVNNRRLYNFWISPKYRNNGYAKRLMAYLLDNDPPTNLRVDPYKSDPGLSQSELAKFYSKFGFKTIKRDSSTIYMERE